MKQPTRKKASSSRSPRRPSTKQSVTFEYVDPSATLMTLVGGFNQWDPKVHPLKRDAGGLWKVMVRLEPGTYLYKFVVNGERWEEDALNLQRVLNEHGTFNSIRKVVPLPVEDHEIGKAMVKGHDEHTGAV